MDWMVYWLFMKGDKVWYLLEYSSILHIKQIFTSLMFCPKFILFVIRQLNKRGKKYLLVNWWKCTCKIAIINNPYTKLASLHVAHVIISLKYVAKLTYAKQKITSLLFVQNQGFCQKIAEKKGVKMIYLVFVLAGISAFINNLYEKLVSLDTNYNTWFEYINPMLTNLFDFQIYGGCLKTG
jgi:hypothetical protein